MNKNSRHFTSHFLTAVSSFTFIFCVELNAETCEEKAAQAAESGDQSSQEVYDVVLRQCQEDRSDKEMCLADDPKSCGQEAPAPTPRREVVENLNESDGPENNGGTGTKNTSNETSSTGSGSNSKSGSSSSSGSRSSYSSVDVNDYQDELDECEKNERIAEECCSRPDRCLTTPDGEDGGDSAIAALLQTGAAVASSIPSSSIGAACGRMKTVANATTAINGYLAAQCSRLVMKCKSICGKPMRELAKAQTSCSSSAGSDCYEIREAKNKFEDSISECGRYDNASMRLAQSAIASQLAAKYFDQCKKLAKNDSSKEEDPFANPDCSSPASASSTFCQAKCSRVNAESDPSCAGFFANQPPGSGNVNNLDPDLGKNKFDNLLSDSEPNQSPQFTDAAPGLGGAIGGGNAGGGGGGGLGGGGDSGGGDGGDPGTGGSGDSGVNANIERGLASGNGYSSSGGFRGYGGGGSSSYSGGILSNTNPKLKPFNLKDYLPGNKLNTLPLRRIASNPSDISPASGNAFKNITRRFYEICLRDRLLDCESLRKMKVTEN